jgi:hypothetical protein
MLFDRSFSRNENKQTFFSFINLFSRLNIYSHIYIYIHTQLRLFNEKCSPESCRWKILFGPALVFSFILFFFFFEHKQLFLFRLPLWKLTIKNDEFCFFLFICLFVRCTIIFSFFVFLVSLYIYSGIFLLSLCIIEIAYVFRAYVYIYIYIPFKYSSLSIFDNYYYSGPNSCKSVLCITISLFRCFFTCRILELKTVYIARTFLSISRKN